MSEYINKIIIPTLDGNHEISLDNKADVDDVYKKSETYNKSEVYNKEEVFKKEEVYEKEESKDLITASSNKSAELLVNVLLAYNSLEEGQGINIIEDWPIDGAAGLDIINDSEGLKGIAIHDESSTNNTKILYNRDSLIYSETTTDHIMNVNGKIYRRLSPPKAYTDVRGRITSMKSGFSLCYGLTSLDFSNFDTSNVTNMYDMFNGCSSLTTLDLSNFDTSNVTNMNKMFLNCKKLTSLDLSSFNTSQVTNMGSMFGSCYKITSLDLSNFNTSQVTSMGSMFSSCNSLTSLDLSNFNTSQVTYMEYMFYECTSLTSLNLSNWNTSLVTRMGSMFSKCTGLTSLDLSNFNTSSVTNMSYMFNNCSKLTSLKFPGMGKTKSVTGIDLSPCPLDHDSLMFIFAYDRVGNGITTTLSVSLSSTSKALLTNEEKAAITAKGYTIA